MSADPSILTAAYVISLIVGGGFVAVSLVFGGHGHGDADFHPDGAGLADGHADWDAGPDADFSDAGSHADHLDHAGDGALSAASWFSMRFVVYFLATFGAVGTVLTYGTTHASTSVLVAALLSGVFVGQAVHQLFRYVKRSGTDSATQIADYIGKPARVTIAIRPAARGEIAVQIGDGERFIPATAKRPSDLFNVGATVAIKEIQSGAAVVVSHEEHEFLQ